MTSTRNTEQPVAWTTPLGLRCVQPYLINVGRHPWRDGTLMWSLYSSWLGPLCHACRGLSVCRARHLITNALRWWCRVSTQ